MAEIKRPTKVIGILPNEDAITHLVGRRRPLTLTSSANDEKFIWSVSGCDGARLTGWRGRSLPRLQTQKAPYYFWTCYCDSRSALHLLVNTGKQSLD
jgi:hypothetical protein